MAYLNLLERSPDPNGFVFYYNLLTSGYPLSNLMINFVMSPEFQNDL